MATAFISSLAHGSPYGSSLFGYPSYWDVTLTGSDYFSGTYDAWCGNPTLFLSVGNTGTVDLYSTYSPASVYTQPNTAIPGSVFSGSTYSPSAAIAQLDNVNWLLNQHYTTNPQFSASEVQLAIWRLLGFSTGSQYLQSADWQEADVQTLVSQASSAAADSFVPGDDDVFAVIADPTFDYISQGTNYGQAQPIIIEARFAKLGDRVWLDANANGAQDAGEAGVAGVTVQLSGTDAFGQAVTRTTTTASDNLATAGVDETGSYLFSRLAPGTYTVTFVLPSGYSFTTQLNPGNADGIANDSDANTATGVTSAVVLSSGEIERDVDAGLYQGAAIGDRVWEDTNANGQQDAGEAGIAGATVRLYTCVNGAPGALVAQTTTNASGNYAFAGLMPGQYIVAFETPSGYTLSTADVGADGTDSDAGAGGLSGCYTLASGETNDTVDAGFWRPAAIGDRVWLDANANGQQDAGEAGVAGVAVELYACANGAPVGSALASTSTDAAGNYGFAGLKPGDYVVKFITPAGYSLSPINIDGDATDSDAGLGGFTACYTLASGETDNSVDAGLYQGAAIGDRVWEDTNANGQQDAGEAGIAGATVRLYTCVNGAPGALVAQTTTNASGNYAFAGLMPGQYIVAFETPSGYTLSTADVGADGTDSDAGAGGLSGCYTLASGETNDTVDAGFWRPAAIGDRVWLDANANGQQDAGEAGVAGVAVELYACANGAPVGSALASTSTDAAGNYGFAGLKPGDYVVKFITPAGFFLTNQNVGANDAADSDADATTGFTGCYKLEAGNTDNSVDAGIFKPGEGGVVPSIDLVKLTNGTDNNAPNGPYLAVGSTATFTYLVTNDGMVALSDIELSDDHGTPGDTSDDFTPVFIGGDADSDGLLDVGETWIYEASTVVTAGQYTNLGAVTGTPADADGNPVPSLPQPTDTDLDNHFGAQVAIDIEKFVRGVHEETAGGGEGLTPGFWKTHSEYGPAPLAGWPETGYAPDDGWEAIFGIDVPGAPTLLDALNAAGGGLDALLRHSTAALLNAAQPNVDYAYAVSQVISLTRDAILSGDADRIESVKDQFVMQNELGADLSTPASGGGTVTTPWFDADAPGTGPFIGLGGTAEFRYEVRNTGDVALADVSVTDDRLAGLSFAGGDTDHDGLLDLDEVWLYSASELVDTAGVDIVNVGTAIGSALGITATDADAARYSTASLSQSLGDFVWMDANRNGLQDSGETGIGGLLVTLTGGGADGIIDGVGDTTATTSTDADGYYQFDGLAAGVQYQVTFGTPAGTAFTTRDVGAGDAIDSDAGADGKSQIVTLSPGQHNPSLDAGVYVLNPGIDLEKTTRGPSNANPTAPDYDNEDAPDGAGVPVLTAGSPVSWTYKLTNTGNVDFAKADLAILDDNGTPANTADDMSIANGKIAYVSGDDGDNVLEAGESWLYEARGTVQPLGALGAATTIDFSGNSAIDGTDGNTRSYTAGGVTVQANAWSRTKGTDTWQKAWLGTYDAGLGVTDSSESGSSSTHTVDNNGRDNYIVFQFSQDVVVDKAFLGYVVGDSDMTVYVGSATAPLTGMNNAVLAGMGLKEFNDTGSTTARWADFNAGDVHGNVLILAARDDGHSADYFKLEKLVFQAVQSGGMYANTATVTAPGGLSDSDMSHYTTVPATPGIDLEKTTRGPSNANPTAPDYDNEDAPDGAGVPVLTAGSPVSWTYKLTNTGNVDFAKADLAILDDNGTPANTADDMSIANGKIAYVSGDDGDNVLEAGESWLYEARGTVQPLGALGAATTIDFSGNSAIDGTDGNTRSYTAGGVTVQANAWSRTKGTDTWQKAWLGTYDAGLGVTDSSESGSSSTHTVDNNGRDNYIVFQFSQDVVVDKAFLGYVVGDSDMTVYVGSATAPLTGMNNAVLAGMGLKEFNDTGSTTARWADFNAGDVHGNVLILAARDDGHSADYFKLEKLVFQAVQSGGMYANTATVTAPGGLSDSDMSHYKVAAPPKFFVVDNADDLSYQYDAGGNGLGNFALSNTDPRDVAANADGSVLWVLDKDKNVDVYTGDGTPLGQWKAYGLGAEPEGITLDGNDLWMGDRAGKLYWYDNAATRTSGTDSPEKSFALSLGGNLKGIVTDGTNLWAVTEGTSDYVYRFKIVRDWSGNPSGLNQSGAWQLPTANAKPTGITLDPSGQSDSLWIVDEATDTVYEYGDARSQTWGLGTVTAQFKLAAGNTAAQGIADPLPPSADAFDLVDASALSGLETMLPDPYAGSFTTNLLDDALRFDDVGLVGMSTENAGTLALLHA